MAYTAHDPQAFFAAILARLIAASGISRFGLAEVPDDTTYPYGIVYPLNDESSEGALNNPTQAVTWAWQVTCVSDGPIGALSMQHRVREALHGHIPVVAGLGTTPIELVDGSGITREDDPQPPLFYSTDRFVALTSI